MPFLIRDDGIVLSFDDVIKRAAQLAHVLTGVGVSPGDRIVVQAGKFSDTIALYAASVQTGAVYLPLNTAYTKAELRYFIADAGPRLVICDPKDAATLTPVAEEVGAVLMTLGGDGGSLQQAANKQPTAFDTLARGPDDLAALFYTSGTTGRSKGAMMSHRNLLSNAQELVQLWRITDQDRLIHALPIFHTHGLFVAMNTSLLAGAQVRLMSGFDLDVLIEEMPRSTLLMGVPTFYTRLLGDARFDRQRAANMRLFISGSAPLLAETHQAFEARSGHRILERYGMTETNMITSNPYDGDRVAGTVGFAVPGIEVKITDPETGTALPAGSIGMIETRGPNVFQGYWNMPVKTAEELREDGFFITGDLAVMASDGRVSIVGRAKDLIMQATTTVWPR